MPELPEVETIRRQLSEVLPITIQKVVASPELFKNVLHTTLPDLQNRRIIRLERIGKWLVFHGQQDLVILSHLGMSGSWLLGPQFSQEKHCHLRIDSYQSGQMERSVVLNYVDPRRFGHLYIFNQQEWLEKKSTLGMDLLDPEFSLDYFKNSLLKSKGRPIKVALLEQKYFTGIGNYMACEICALAKVLPQKMIKDLTQSEFKKLYEAIPAVIHPMIEHQGLSFSGGYRDSAGSDGGGLKGLKVFHQKICQMCLQQEIQKCQLAGRGTFFCSVCQN